MAEAARGAVEEWRSRRAGGEPGGNGQGGVDVLAQLRGGRDVKGAPGALWLSVVLVGVRRYMLHSLQRTILVGAALGALPWLLTRFGWWPGAERHRRRRSRPARDVASLLGQAARGVFTVIPLYLSARTREMRSGQGRRALGVTPT